MVLIIPSSVVVLLSTFLVLSGAEFSALAGYRPNSDVDQHSRIDLDQRDFEAFLKEGKWDKAGDIYVNGGNSMKSIKIDLATPLKKTFSKGSEVSQRNARGNLIRDAKVGDTRIKVGVVSKCAGNYAMTPNKEACFVDYQDGSEISIAGEIIESRPTVTAPFRTLAGFSVQAESKMKNQTMFEMFRGFYGASDYANKFVTSALKGHDEDKRVKVAMKFLGKSDIYRIECAQKGSSYWSLWMYVIREMEDAILDCRRDCLACNDAPVHAWDEAAAFYVGSLEKKEGSPSGKLLYRLAEKRCKNFNTCGGGRSAVNKYIMAKMEEGRNKLVNGKCGEVKEIRDRIIEAMSIPLIQGTLRYAYKIGKLGGGDKEKAEGVAFLGAVLPRLDNCNKMDAEILMKRMWIDGEMGKDGFEVVKEAFQRNYQCLGVTCDDIGGLLDETVGDYYQDFHPCRTSSSQKLIISNIVIAFIVSFWSS